MPTSTPHGKPRAEEQRKARVADFPRRVLDVIGHAYARSDIDPTSIVPLNLIGRHVWQHKNGTIVQAADYNGFRALTPSKEPRYFLAVTPGDLSVDWLDITDQIGNFIVDEKVAA